MCVVKLAGFSNIEGFKPTISTEKPQEVNKKTTDDTVLDLSKDSIENELLHQDLSKVTSVQVGDKLLTGLSKEDVLKLVESLKKECLDAKGGFKLKTDFKMVNFAEDTGITILKSDFNDKTESASMATRAKERLNISDEGDIQDIVRADLALITKKFSDPSTNKLQAGKMLMQDLSLLESKGLLSKPDRDTYLTVLRNITESYKKNNTNISQEDLDKLKDIAKRYVDIPASGLMLNQDTPKLDKLGTPDAGNIDDQYQTVAQNSDSILAESDASIHDLAMSTKEVGAFSRKDVQGGRDIYSRIPDAVKRVEGQFALINDKVLPALSAKIEDLNTKITAKISEITGLSDPEEIKMALAKDPALAQKVKEATSAMILEQNDAISKYKQLSEKLQALGKARVEGVTELGSIRTIDAQMKARIATLESAGATLARGATDLKGLKTKIDNVITLPVSQQQAELDKYKAEIVKIRDEMKGKIQSLMDTYKGNPNVTPLLQKELETLKALETSDPAKAVLTLEQSRRAILDGLKVLVPKKLDQRELDALNRFDGKVVSYAEQDKLATSAVKLTQEAVTIAKEEEEKKKTAGDADKKAQEEGFDMIKKFEEHLSWGSHFGVSLEIGAGVGKKFGSVGAQVGVAVEAALKVEYCFGKGPFWLAHVDLNAKIQGEVSLGEFLKLEGEYSAGVAAGLGFDNLTQVKEFGEKIATLIMKAKNGDNVDNEKAELLDIIQKHKYKATQESISGSLKVGPVTVGYAQSSVTGHYTTVDGDPLDVKDTEKKGSFKVTAGGKDYTVRGVVQTSENITPEAGKTTPKTDSAPIKRVLGTFVMPVSAFEAVYKSRSLAEVPPEVISSMVGFMTKLDPSFAAMSTEKIFGLLNKGLSFAIDKNPRLMASVLKGAQAQPDKAGTTLSSNTGVAFSIEYENNSNPPKWNFQIALEGEAQIKQDVPLGAAGYARIKAKTDYEVGFKVNLYQEDKK
ncbi:MAG: hypothetical protein U0457_15415 [Candidatus Sericytochromatia bacterium]